MSDACCSQIRVGQSVKRLWRGTGGRFLEESRTIKKKTTNNGLVKQCVVISVAAIIARACPRCSAVIAGGEKMKGSGALEGERKMENDNGLLGSSWVHAGPSYHPWGWPNYSSV